MSYKIIDKWVTPNPYSRPKTKMSKVKGIVVHWVAVPYGSASGVFNFFEGRKNGKNNYGSAHETIDLDGSIWRMIPENEIAYHVGAVKYKERALKELSTYPNNCTYGIECTHIDAKGKMSDTVYNTLVERVADLCKRWSLDPLKNLYLHYDITGKDCHKWFVDNPKEWELFKNKVKIRMNGGQVIPQTSQTTTQTKPVYDVTKGIGTVRITSDELNVRSDSSFTAPVVKKVFKNDVYYVYSEKNGLYNVGGNNWLSANKSYVEFTAHPKQNVQDTNKGESNVGSNLSEWNISVAHKAIDELAKIQYEEDSNGKPLYIINDAKQWKDKVSNGTVSKDMDWLFFVTMERVAKSLKYNK